MPRLIPSNKFLKDMEAFRLNSVLRKNIAKALAFLEKNPLHPVLHLDRIINDPRAWSIRVDRRYRISFDPQAYQSSGNPDWTDSILLLRILDHDVLYKSPR